MDFGAYNQALECYQIILKQDVFYLPDSDELASDYNNIGLCLGLVATTSNTAEKRLDSFTRAMASLREAERRYRRVNNLPGLISCLTNQYILLNDMHRRPESARNFLNR